VVTIRDIYAQRAAEMALAQSELRFHMAFDGNVAPMTVTNLEDRITAVNDSFCAMVGYSREELMGKDSKIFTYPEDVGITEESHRRALFGEADQNRYISDTCARTSAVIFVEVSRTPARDEEGKLLYFVFSERDITEERATSALNCRTRRCTTRSRDWPTVPYSWTDCPKPTPGSLDKVEPVPCS